MEWGEGADRLTSWFKQGGDEKGIVVGRDCGIYQPQRTTTPSSFICCFPFRFKDVEGRETLWGEAVSWGSRGD